MGDCGTILVVDHDETTRTAAVHVAARLGYDVISVASGAGLLDRIDGDQPALALIEVELPGELSGLELLRELHGRFGDDLPVILVSASRTAPLDRVAGLLLGADDYLAKPFDTGELLARARRSLRRTAAPAGNGNGRQTADVSLSPREREILRLLAEGRSQKQIAAALVISPKTVATHIQHLLSKLGVHSRAQAVSAAYRSGLVEADVSAHALVAVLVPPH
jgi:DNA-binding NarL/FixJ family response regulator